MEANNKPEVINVSKNFLKLSIPLPCKTPHNTPDNSQPNTPKNNSLKKQSNVTDRRLKPIVDVN